MGRGDKEVFPRRLDTNVAGAEGELTVSVSGRKAFVHDGKTPGGVALVDALGAGLFRTPAGFSMLNLRPIRVVGIGDSIMQGNSNSNDAGIVNGSPVPLNWNDSSGVFETSLWKANADTSAYAQYQFMANQGIGGQTSAQILARMQTDVIALKPDVAFIIAGTNDLLGNMGDEGRAALMSNIEQMIIQCIAEGIVPILCTPPPKTDLPFEPTEIQPYFYDLARFYGILLLDMYRVVVDPATGGYKAGWSADGVHPSPVAIDAISTEFAKALAAPQRYINRPYLSATGSLLVNQQANMCLNGNFTQGLDGGGNPLAWTAGLSGTNTLAVTANAALPFTGKKFVYTVPANGTDQLYPLFSNNINSGFEPGDVLEFAAGFSQSGMVPGTSNGNTFQLAFDGAGGFARPINLFPFNGDFVVNQQAYVPQGCTTINVQMYSQDKNVVYTLQNVTLTNRSARERIWTPGQS